MFTIDSLLVHVPFFQVRNMFSKLLVYLCQVSNDDGPYPVIGPENMETKGRKIPALELLAHVSYIRWYQIS